MRRAYQVESIRYAEAEADARLPIGALMQRAAAGLATVAGAHPARCPADLTASRVVLLVASGQRQRRAVRGAMLARRGVRVDAVLMEPGTGARGRARGRSWKRAGEPLLRQSDMTVLDAAD